MPTVILIERDDIVGSEISTIRRFAVSTHETQPEAERSYRNEHLRFEAVHGNNGTMIDYYGSPYFEYRHVVVDRGGNGTASGSVVRSTWFEVI